LAKVSKANVIACKRIKGGRAGCWIKQRGKTVFRFVNPDRLSGLGIPIVSAAQAVKLLPGLAGGKLGKTSGLGFTFDGKNCRDAQGQFVPVPQCVRRGLTTKKRPRKKKTTRKRKTTRKGKR